MDDFVRLVLVIVGSFLMGSLPFSYWARSYFDKQKLELVQTAAYPHSITYYMPGIVIPLGLFVMELLKAIFAIWIGDFFLGTEEYSLVLATACCLLGNVITRKIVLRKNINTWCLWPVFLYFDPFSTVIIGLLGLLILVISSNVFLAQIFLAVSFIAYYLLNSTPLSYFIYSGVALLYILLININVLFDFRLLGEKNLYLLFRKRH